MISESEIDDLLANTKDLFLNIFTFDCKGHSAPGKSHRGAAIAHQDLVERRADFLRELRNTMCAWVYAKKKYKEILDAEIARRGGDYQNAISQIQEMVSRKFRKGFPKGQFGELLLFNFIQHVFKAPPILRKMSLTTNAALERNGADAIHYRPSNDANVIYLGEAKSYASSFAAAINAAVDSIIKAHSDFVEELDLYIYEDFIDESLREIARSVKRNELENMQVELVCIVGYDEDSDRAGKSQADIENLIVEAVQTRLKKQEKKHRKEEWHCAVANSLLDPAILGS